MLYDKASTCARSATSPPDRVKLDYNLSHHEIYNLGPSLSISLSIYLKVYSRVYLRIYSQSDGLINFLVYLNLMSALRRVRNYMAHVSQSTHKLRR